MARASVGLFATPESWKSFTASLPSNTMGCRRSPLVTSFGDSLFSTWPSFRTCAKKTKNKSRGPTMSESEEHGRN